MHNNKVVLVGAGPGDIGLLTLKGLEYIKNADCIIYDRLLNPALLSMSKLTCEKIFVGKRNHHHTMKQDNINELLYEKSKDYKLVVRLKGGDPYVFGRGGEEALYLKKRGVEVEVVPGISSSIAALNAAGIPITHRGLSKGFQVITAHSRLDERTNINYELLQDKDVTLVFLMGLGHIKEISEELISAGRSKNTPAAVISNGTTNHQKKCVGTLSDITKKAADANIDSPAIIVVGEVVTLSSELNFFENRPLFGKKYFVPTIKNFNYSLEDGVVETTNNELVNELINLGAEVFRLQSGSISPVKLDLNEIKNFESDDIVVFTSANAVKAFFWNLYEVNNLDIRSLGKIKFAAIGSKTAASLRKFGIVADFVSKRQTGMDLAVTLNEGLESGVKLHWFCGKETSEDFEKNLRPDFTIKKTICYENVMDYPENADEFMTAIKECEAVIFTSGSNASYAYKYFPEAIPDEIYSIGPACSKRILSLGCRGNLHEARVSSYNGIMELLV